MQAALSKRRIRKKKKMPVKLAEDEQLASAETDFQVKVHNAIVDTLTGSIHKSFFANAKLCSDFACVDHRNFAHVCLSLTTGIQLAHYVENCTALHLSGTD